MRKLFNIIVLCGVLSLPLVDLVGLADPAFAGDVKSTGKEGKKK